MCSYLKGNIMADLSNLAGDYKILEEVHLPGGLSDKSFHISTDGIKIQPVSNDISGFSKSLLFDLYRNMVITRLTDQEILKFSRKGMAFGKHLMSTGNEATAVGAAYAMGDSDWLLVAIRGLGAVIVRGMSIDKILCQAMGRIDGFTNGWDGSLHMGDRGLKIAGFVSHLGTMPLVSTGCAFSQKYKKDGGASLVFSGDGATSTGDVHEALNLASVLELPLVMIIENNQWAFGTPNRFQYTVPTLALRALGYGRKVEGYWIDGTNVLTVYLKTLNALRRAREKGVISIIETATMRMEGHSLADPFKSYVPEEQLSEWDTFDPISRYRQLLIDAGLIDEEELQKIDNETKEEIRKASELAETSDKPSVKDMICKIFVPTPNHKIEIINTVSEGNHITYHQAIKDVIREEMERDKDIFIIGEDIGVSDGPFKITEGLMRDFDGIDWNDHWRDSGYLPRRRVIDAPLAEAAICGLATGAALGDLKAIVEFQYADFSSEAFKMLVNYISSQIVKNMGPLPIVFRMPSGWTSNSSIYHSINPETWFAATPGLKIVAPITSFDAKGLFRASIRDGNPVLFLEYKGYYRLKPENLPRELDLAVPDEDYIIPIGKARVVKKGGNLTIVTYGSQLFRALEAVRQVEKEREVAIEVIDLRTLIPYDKECINHSIHKTSKALVTCEASRTGCFGQTIAHNIQEDNYEVLDGPVKLVASLDTPCPFAPELEEAYLPTVEKLIIAINDLLKY
jgi:2-oxoisovalerate dehydrogenase E1 component